MVKYVRGVLMNGIIAVITYNCNITCSNCSYGCGPHRKGMMSPECFKQRVTEAYSQGYGDYLEIAGGEPFLHTGIVFKYLKKIKHIETKKLIVTNGFWGRLNYYMDILMELKDSGVSEVVLEYDSFHSVFIDQETILEAIKKSFHCGIGVRIRSGFETSSLSTAYDLRTLELIRSIRRKQDRVRFECKTGEKYMGLYRDEGDTHRRIILP
jgi:molybdenum cofactor biosynthesis enzyme MoaA